jgi:peptide/nickel transport system ATP-binding protein
MSEKLFEVKNLSVEYTLGSKTLPALDGISFCINRGEVLGVAGESGCGKSTLALSIMRLLPKSGNISEGQIRFKDQELTKLSEEQMDRQIRGKEIAMIFQNPQLVLNPVFTVETQMIDVLRFQKWNTGKSGKRIKKLIRQKAIEQLKETGIATPEERISNYPFEFSGGMKQRVMIAMALSSRTSLLIADEPTTALDVTIEAQILELLKELATKYQSSILYISHDLEVLSEVSNNMIIMYAGRIFEMGTTAMVFDQPRHPYSVALLEALPSNRDKTERLLSIPGHVPPLHQLPSGCTFHPRCPFAEDVCAHEIPSLVEVTQNHWSACLLDVKRGGQRWKWN